MRARRAAVYSGDVKSALSRACYRLYLPLAVLCAWYLAIRLVQHSAWNKQRLFHRLVCGNEQQQLEAASALAQYGAQEQLLAGIKSEAPLVRDLARRALDYVWFRAAGPTALHQLEDAFEAAQKENLETALKLLDEVVEKYPDFAEGWNRRASVYWQMGQYEKSAADCQRAIVLNPNHYGAWQGIGVCRLKMGNVAEACRCLRAALQIIPHDETTRHCLQECEELLRALPPARTPGDERSSTLTA